MATPKLRNINLTNITAYIIFTYEHGAEYYWTVWGLFEMC